MGGPGLAVVGDPGHAADQVSAVREQPDLRARLVAEAVRWLALRGVRGDFL
jgi:hypothetical protein